MPRMFYGVDIGDGETAVARVVEGSEAEPQILEIRGRKSPLTALGIDQDGTRYIGEEALQVSGVQQLHLRFKSQYLSEEGARQWMEAYAHALVESMQEEGTLTAPEDMKAFIGCPSGWDAQTRASYKLLMERAGFRNITIVSESRAALVYAKESGELRVAGDQLQRPTLIIDAGSSTTDYTFIAQMQERQLNDSGEVALGGGILDALLLEYTIDQRDDREALGELLRAYPALWARCEMEARKVKEMYFVNKRRGRESTYLNESSVKLHTNPPYRVDIHCDDAIMNRLLKKPVDALGGQGYLETYEQSLRSLKGRLETEPEIVLMTGGASHMPFMQEIAAEAYPKASIVMGNEPEYAIARGLCYALRMDEKRAAFTADVQALIQSDAVEQVVTDMLDPLFEELSPVLVDVIADVLAPDVFTRWRSGEIRTLNDMVSAMSKEAGDLMQSEEIHELLRPATAQWLSLLRPQLEELTNPICDRYGLPRTSLRLPGFVLFSAEAPVSGTGIVDFTSVKLVLDVIIAAVVATILGGTETALLMTGPVGLLIGFVIGIITAWVGVSLAEKWVMGMDIALPVRKLFSQRMLLGKLKNGKGEMIAKLNEQLSSKVDERSAEIMEMVNSISQTIERQLQEEMERAVLQIH